MKTISVPKGFKIAVVGDIHEHQAQAEAFLEYVSSSEEPIIAVSVGDIYDKGFGDGAAEAIVDLFQNLNEEKFKGTQLRKGYIIRGNHELKRIRKAKKAGALTPQLEWMAKQPISLVFEFHNRTRVTVVHAGVTPKTTVNDLLSNVEVCYVRTIDKNGKHVRLSRKVKDGKLYYEPEKKGKLWHKLYDGRLGYIASGHIAQEDGVPRFYNYSCNLDTAVYHTGKLTAQVFSEKGKEDLLTFTGPARYPDLDILRTAGAKGK